MEAILREFHVDHGKKQSLALVDADQEMGNDYVLHIGRVEFREELRRRATAASRSEGASGSPGGDFTHSLL
jgi:3-dehydroquinate dehydratase